MVGFSSVSLFPQGNGRVSPRVEPFKQGDRPPGIVKCWEDRGVPQAHSVYIHVKKELYKRGPPRQPTNEPRIPHPIYIYILLHNGKSQHCNAMKRRVKERKQSYQKKKFPSTPLLPNI